MVTENLFADNDSQNCVVKFVKRGVGEYRALNFKVTDNGDFFLSLAFFGDTNLSIRLSKQCLDNVIVRFNANGRQLDLNFEQV